MAQSHRGFSLIEPLILDATAIPDFLKSKTAANQTSAVGSLKMIVSAEVSYASTYTIVDSSTLVALDGTAIPSTSASAGPIDILLAPGAKSSYSIYSVPCVNPYPPNDGKLSAACTAPITLCEVSGTPSGGTGFGNFYFTEPSGVIRQNSSAPVGLADTPTES